MGRVGKKVILRRIVQGLAFGVYRALGGYVVGIFEGLDDAFVHIESGSL
jgi:hypothetical protein